MKPRRPLARQSARHKALMKEYEKVRLAWWLQLINTYGQAPHCPVMFTIFRKFVPCSRHPHHIYGRGKYLLDTSTWLACSLAGHRWIDANREKARKHGWLAPRGQWQNKHD